MRLAGEMGEALMNNSKQDLQPDAKARRKLLRGAFGAPAVLTLYSGGARAASSVSTCLVRANSTPLTSGIGVANADDILLRVRLYGLVNGGGNVSTYWIRGADLSALQRNGQRPFLTSQQFQRFDVANNVLVAGTVTNAEPTAAGRTFKATNQYVVLRVSSTGQVVGAGATGAGGAPVGDSCWNSFVAGSVP